MLPDPEFPISDSGRRTREAAVMSAYSLQQQLASARGAYEKVAGQIPGARTNGTLGAADRLSAQASELLDQLSHCLTDAYNVEVAMDAYQGLPTAAQLQELDSVWSEGIAAVAGLNRLIEDTGLAAVPIPVR